MNRNNSSLAYAELKPQDFLEALEDLGREWKLLVIAEDWCGDASNLVPVDPSRFRASTSAPESSSSCTRTCGVALVKPWLRSVLARSRAGGASCCLMLAEATLFSRCSAI